MRYPKGSWEAGAARSHCKTHDGSFEAAGSASVEETPVVLTLIHLNEMEMRIVTLINEQYNKMIEQFKALYTPKASGLIWQNSLWIKVQRMKRL